MRLVRHWRGLLGFVAWVSLGLGLGVVSGTWFPTSAGASGMDPTCTVTGSGVIPTTAGAVGAPGQVASISCSNIPANMAQVTVGIRLSATDWASVDVYNDYSELIGGGGFPSSFTITAPTDNVGGGFCGGFLSSCADNGTEYVNITGQAGVGDGPGAPSNCVDVCVYDTSFNPIACDSAGAGGVPPIRPFDQQHGGVYLPPPR